MVLVRRAVRMRGATVQADPYLQRWDVNYDATATTVA